MNELEEAVAEQVMDGLRLYYTRDLNAAIEVARKLGYMNFKVTRQNMDDFYIANFGPYVGIDTCLCTAICKAALHATDVYEVRKGV